MPLLSEVEENVLEGGGIKTSATLNEVFCESDDDEVFKIEAYNGEDLEEGKKSD